METKKSKTLNLFLIILSVLAALKMIFFAVGLDEEYQVVMSYRNCLGDKLFLEMWEPHQSSAFLCVLAMKPYLKLFGTTGVILYLRLYGTLLHLGVSVYLYKVFRRIVGKDYAWLLALIYFNTIPKQIMLPEFGIMQVWFYTLLSLFLIQYYHGGRKAKYLILAAAALALCVLSYPSCLILFPFVIICLARLSGKDKWRDMGIFTLVCALGAAGYLGMLFTYTSPKELLGTLSYIVKGDASHSFSFGSKIVSFLQKGGYEAAVWAGCLLTATIIAKWKRLDRGMRNCLTIMLSCAVQLFYWIVLNTGYEALHIHLITIAAAGLCTPVKSASSLPVQHTDTAPHGASGENPALHAASDENMALHEPSESAPPIDGNGKADAARLLRYGIWGAVVCLLAVVYLTDISLTESIPHAMPAAVFGAALLILSSGPKPQNAHSRTAADKYSKWVYAALLVWCLTAVFGKGYTLRAGAHYNNVLQTGGIMKKGPAAGTFSNYICAYIYNCDYEDWQNYIQDGDRVLIMVDQILNLSTIQYLFKDVDVCHFSVVNCYDFVYDERMLEYWEMYPDKKPNVIIVDCWYGELMTDPDSWFMQYIENDFGYTQAIDGTYIRIYRR